MLVVACAAGGIVATQQLGERREVVALARPVDVGHVILQQDLVGVSLAVDDAVKVVPASAASSVVGRQVAYSLPVGVLLTDDVLGPPQVPGEGRAITALGLKPGQFPPEVSAGSNVVVLASASNEGGSVSSWRAVVVSVDRTDQTQVISVELTEVDARELSSTPADKIAVLMVGGR
ncbi:flagellar biosynthesis protein FlgA [Lentzea cavernae]|uniref:flagellar biosynthesis protein FlgA n=1 Tax=Lentzea cavernae TaxID=2020703 RepID=UPI00174E761A|nr:flagellar biosynthesis protein FlgA [Lentzea cavernae]